jgi:aromatic ring hydroxylase
MNTTEDHRTRVIQWLELLIMSEINEALEGMNGRGEAQKVQEAYWTSKSIAKRRYVGKVQSSPCPIEVGTVKSHFSEM